MTTRLMCNACRMILRSSAASCYVTRCHSGDPSAQYFWAEVTGRPIALSCMMWLHKHGQRQQRLQPCPVQDKLPVVL